MLGIAADASAKVLTALAAQLILVRSSLPKPPISEANALRPAPSNPNCAPNNSNDNPPPINLLMPFKKFAAVRIMIVSARALIPSSIDGLIVDDITINGIAFIINCDNCVPRSANDDAKGLRDAIELIKLVAVSATIVAASIPIPSSIEESTILIPTINGVAFIINSERFLPISGSPEDNPAPIPPIMLPTKLPIA